FSPEQIFKVVVDVDKYHKFVPWCTKSVVYHQQVSLANRPSIVPEARGLVVPSRRVPADLEVGYSAFQERYTSMVTSEEPWRVEVKALSHNSNLFRELRTTWEFIPLSAVPAPQLRALRYDPKLYHSMGQDGSGACLVRFHIKFQFTSELYSRVSQMFFDGVCKEMVNAFKNRCRQVY
ncbi:cyclase/dehydrase, partial [Dimargaris cristalligena]